MTRGGARGPVPHALTLAVAGCGLTVMGAAWRDLQRFQRGFVPVLLYHAISDDTAERHQHIVQRKAFARQMRWLVRRGYEPSTCSRLQRDAQRARKRVAITFDDGFASVHRHALPVLGALGLSATVFVSTDFVEHSTRFPWDYAWSDPPLSVEQIRTLVNEGWEIASHGCSHADLRLLCSDALERELRHSREVIAGWSGSSPRAFAYPHGYVDDRVQTAVAAAGYEFGFGVLVLPEVSGPLAIPRQLVRNQTTMLGFRLRVWGVHPWLKSRRWFMPLRPLLRRWRWAFL